MIIICKYKCLALAGGFLSGWGIREGRMVVFSGGLGVRGGESEVGVFGRSENN